MKSMPGWRRRLRGLIGAGLLVLLPRAVAAGTVSLAWDPNSEADLAGYKVHFGASSRTYTQTIDVGNRTTVILSTLLDGQTYFFAVTAYDIFANESGFSSEVSATVANSNTPPRASFTFTCSNLNCTFTNMSEDLDGTVVGSNWKFGDGASSGERSPRYGYLSAGKYTVNLMVTDNAGLTHSTSQNVAVSTSAGADIALSVNGYKERGLQKADLTWQGPTSNDVDVFRNGSKITTTANDGSYTDNIGRGQGTYTYQICVAGTLTCSTGATITTK
jgi:PKD repeat protein